MSAYLEQQRARKNERSSAAGFPSSREFEGEEGLACRARGVIEENVFLSTLICFGAGLAVGTVVGRLLAGPPETATASFRRRFVEALESAVPDAVREKISR